LKACFLWKIDNVHYNYDLDPTAPPAHPCAKCHASLVEVYWNPSMHATDITETTSQSITAMDGQTTRKQPPWLCLL